MPEVIYVCTYICHELRVGLTLQRLKKGRTPKNPFLNELIQKYFCVYQTDLNIEVVPAIKSYQSGRTFTRLHTQSDAVQ